MNSAMVARMKRPAKRPAEPRTGGDSDDPFVAFQEWNGEVDTRAYDRLHEAPIARSSRWMSSSRPR
jgi:hypothetical protein